MTLRTPHHKPPSAALYDPGPAEEGRLSMERDELDHNSFKPLR